MGWISTLNALNSREVSVNEMHAEYLSSFQKPLRRLGVIGVFIFEGVFRQCCNHSRIPSSLLTSRRAVKKYRTRAFSLVSEKLFRGGGDILGKHFEIPMRTNSRGTHSFVPSLPHLRSCYFDVCSTRSGLKLDTRVCSDEDSSTSV